jgi:hypothetical protein
MKYSICGIIAIISLFSFCSTNLEQEGPFMIQKGKVYGKSQESDKKQIEEIFSIMVQSVIDRDMNRLSPFINDSLGIWIDLKAKWTKKEFIENLNQEENYFDVYFYSTDKLRKKKNNSESWSVRDILIQSKGINLDYYFESKDECELDLNFNESSELEGDLANPVFKKIGGKWYIYRLF